MLRFFQWRWTISRLRVPPTSSARAGTPTLADEATGPGAPYPNGVAVDTAGDVYVADNGNKRVLGRAEVSLNLVVLLTPTELSHTPLPRFRLPVGR
jgi:DNA-binding beta-propeller fold protein YncE